METVGGKGLTSNPDSSSIPSSTSVTGPSSYTFVSLLGLTSCSLLLLTLTGVIIALFRKASRNHYHNQVNFHHHQEFEEHMNEEVVPSNTGVSFSMKHQLTSDLSSLTYSDSIFGGESTCLENQLLGQQPQLHNQCPLDLTFDIKHAINYETSV